MNISTFTNVNDLFLSISKGDITDYAALNKIGENSAVGTSEESLIGNAGAYVFPAAAAALKVASTSANDTAEGSGARTVTVTGLNSSYVEISEVVTLGGNTAATTVATFLRVNSVVVTTVGNGGKNAGTIFVFTGASTGGTPDDLTTVRAVVAIGANESNMASYTVPAGKTLYIVRIFGSSIGTDAIEGRLYIKIYGSVFKKKAIVTFKGDDASYAPKIPLVVTEKSDIDLRVVGAAGGDAATGGFDAILVTNEVVTEAETPVTPITLAAFNTYLTTPNPDLTVATPTLLVLGLDDYLDMPTTFLVSNVIASVSAYFDTDVFTLTGGRKEFVCNTRDFDGNNVLISTAKPYICFVWKSVDSDGVSKYVKPTTWKAYPITANSRIAFTCTAHTS